MIAHVGPPGSVGDDDIGQLLSKVLTACVDLGAAARHRSGAWPPPTSTVPHRAASATRAIARDPAADVVYAGETAGRRDESRGWCRPARDLSRDWSQKLEEKRIRPH